MRRFGSRNDRQPVVGRRGRCVAIEPVGELDQRLSETGSVDFVLRPAQPRVGRQVWAVRSGVKVRCKPDRGIGGARRSDPGRRQEVVDPRALVLLCVWCGAGAAILLLAGVDVLGRLVATQLFAFAVLSFGVIGFLEHGGPRISAAGLFCASSAAFVGYAAWWWTVWHPSVGAALLEPVAFSFFSLVPMYYLFWWSTRASVLEVQRGSALSAPNSILLGLVIAVLGLAVRIAQIAVIEMRGVVSFGIVLVCIGLVFMAGSSWRVMMARFTLLCLLAAYVLLMFSVFGRLVVIVVFVGAAIVLSWRFGHRGAKVMGIVLVPLAAEFLTRVRSENAGRAMPDASYGDSDVGGIATFAELMAHPELSWGFGKTLFTTMIVWIPRSLWPSKPVGFGAVLTEELRPELVSVGHSMVATVFGEMYFNFGWFGLPVGIVLLGVLVRFLDNATLSLISEPDAGRRSAPRDLALLALLVMASAQLVSMVWGDTNTWGARLIVPSVLALGLVLVSSFREELSFSSSARRNR